MTSIKDAPKGCPSCAIETRIKYMGKTIKILSIYTHNYAPLRTKCGTCGEEFYLSDDTLKTMQGLICHDRHIWWSETKTNYLIGRRYLELIFREPFDDTAAIEHMYPTGFSQRLGIVYVSECDPIGREYIEELTTWAHRAGYVIIITQETLWRKDDLLTNIISQIKSHGLIKHDITEIMSKLCSMLTKEGRILATTVRTSTKSPKCEVNNDKPIVKVTKPLTKHQLRGINGKPGASTQSQAKTTAIARSIAYKPIERPAANPVQQLPKPAAKPIEHLKTKPAAKPIEQLKTKPVAKSIEQVKKPPLPKPQPVPTPMSVSTAAPSLDDIPTQLVRFNTRPEGFRPVTTTLLPEVTVTPVTPVPKKIPQVACRSSKIGGL
jgi:hypothetical protein